MPENEIVEWFQSIPLISRWWFTLSILFPLLGRIGLLNIMSMVLLWEPVVYHFQIWRLFTSVVYYPVTPQTGFNYLINLYFLYSYSTRLETGLYEGRPADFLFMLLFNWVVLIVIGFIVPIYLLMDCLIISVLYVWCQVNRDTIVQFWFGLQFKAMYLPWVLAAFQFILRGGGVTELVGIIVGHLFFFLMFKYPQDFGGTRFISTPSILYKYLPNRQGGVSGFGMAPSNRRPRNNANDNGNWGEHLWGGGGRRLGDE